MRTISINRGDPEALYSAVYNGTTSKMSVGYIPYWDHGTGLTDTLLGVQVTAAANTATYNHGKAAGAVAFRDIEGGKHGWVQVYGVHKSLWLTGATGAPLRAGLQTAVSNDTASNAQRYLVPANEVGTTGAVGVGFLGLVAIDVITGTGTVTIPVANQYYAGGHAILYPGTGTVSTDATATTGKAFLHFV